MRRLAAAALLLAACATTPPPHPSRSRSRRWKRKRSKLQKFDGYIPLFWDAENGKLLMQISRFGEELLYQSSLPAGVGSNPIGLDRGLMGQTQIVTFDRVGPKVLMTATNYRFRAISNDDAERRAVADSFARSVMWSFKVEASDATFGADRCDRFLSQRSAGDHAHAAPDAAGELLARPQSQRDLPAADEGVSEKHRDRSDPHVSDRRDGREPWSAASRRLRTASPCANIIPSRSCRRPAIRRGAPIRASASSASISSTTPAPSPDRSRSSGSRGIG